MNNFQTLLILYLAISLSFPILCSENYEIYDLLMKFESTPSSALNIPLTHLATLRKGQNESTSTTFSKFLIAIYFSFMRCGRLFSDSPVTHYSNTRVLPSNVLFFFTLHTRRTTFLPFKEHDSTLRIRNSNCHGSEMYRCLKIHFFRSSLNSAKNLGSFKFRSF